jgi:hypothetical protein
MFGFRFSLQATSSSPITPIRSRSTIIHVTAGNPAAYSNQYTLSYCYSLRLQPTATGQSSPMALSPTAAPSTHSHRPTHNIYPMRPCAPQANQAVPQLESCQINLVRNFQLATIWSAPKNQTCSPAVASQHLQQEGFQTHLARR